MDIDKTSSTPKPNNDPSTEFNPNSVESLTEEVRALSFLGKRTRSSRNDDSMETEAKSRTVVRIESPNTSDNHIKLRHIKLRGLIRQNDDAAFIALKDYIESNDVFSKDSYFSESLIECASKQNNDEIFNFILERSQLLTGQVDAIIGMAFIDKALYNVCVAEITTRQKINRCRQLLSKGWSFDAIIDDNENTILEELAWKKVNFNFIFDEFPDVMTRYFESKDHQVRFFELILIGKHTEMMQFMIYQLDPNVILNACYADCILRAFQFGSLEIACDLWEKYPKDKIVYSSSLGTPLQVIADKPSCDIALSVNYTRIIKIFLSKGFDINEENYCQVSPSDNISKVIQMSVFHLNVPYTKALIDNKADTQVVNENLNLLDLAMITHKKTEFHNSAFIAMLKLLRPYFSDKEFDESVFKTQGEHSILARPEGGQILEALMKSSTVEDMCM